MNRPLLGAAMPVTRSAATVETTNTKLGTSGAPKATPGISLSKLGTTHGA
jgi:hypothetical protein